MTCQTEPGNAQKEKAPKPASKLGKPPTHTHLFLNTGRPNPSQVTDKPCPGELHHKKIHHPRFSASLSNVGQTQQKKSSERGTGIPTKQSNERAKIMKETKETDKGKTTKKNRQTAIKVKKGRVLSFFFLTDET